MYAHSEAELKPVKGGNRTAGLSRYPTKHGSSAGTAWANSADHYAFQFPSDERNGEHNSVRTEFIHEVIARHSTLSIGLFDHFSQYLHYFVESIILLGLLVLLLVSGKLITEVTVNINMYLIHLAG